MRRRRGSWIMGDADCKPDWIDGCIVLGACVLGVLIAWI